MPSLGKAYVPIPADILHSRERTILDLLEVDQSLDESEVRISKYLKEDFETVVRDLQGHIARLPNYNPNETAYILFTSGSTVFKGCKISFNNVKSFID